MTTSTALSFSKCLLLTTFLHEVIHIPTGSFGLDGFKNSMWIAPAK
jgi:hypothetical protein